MQLSWGTHSTGRCTPPTNVNEKGRLQSERRNNQMVRWRHGKQKQEFWCESFIVCGQIHTCASENW
jgi:hypothetical protein